MGVIVPVIELKRRKNEVLIKVMVIGLWYGYVTSLMETETGISRIAWGLVLSLILSVAWICL